MTTRSAQVQVARKRARRARAARRRRTLGGVLAFAAIVALGALLLRPLFTHAVHDLTTLPLRHQDAIREQAREKQLDPSLIAGVIYAESKFSDSTSPVGALGLMQLMPETAHFIAQRSGGTAFTTEDLSTPEINIAYGSWYLRYLLDRYGGDEVLVFGWSVFAVMALAFGVVWARRWRGLRGGSRRLRPRRRRHARRRHASPGDEGAGLWGGAGRLRAGPRPGRRRRRAGGGAGGRAGAPHVGARGDRGGQDGHARGDGRRGAASRVTAWW